MIYDLKLPLLLLKAGILFVNYIQPAFSSHNLAIHAAFLNWSSYLHCSWFYY